MRAEALGKVTISDVTGSSKLLVPGKVTAATDIPQGAMTIPIEPMLLRGQPDVVQISVGITSYGTIELENRSNQIWCKDVHWVRALRLSDDCHSYNVQLKLDRSERPCISNQAKKRALPKLLLQVVKPVEQGQELMLWFSEDILALLQMVFLTPGNIQGQKKYVCTRCSALYESPNPLKLHITLACGRLTIAALWDKLASLVSDFNKCGTTSPTTLPEFSFKLTPPLLANKQKTALDLSKQSEKRPTSQPAIVPCQNTTETCRPLYRPFSEPPTAYASAFKPFQKPENSSNNNLIQIEGYMPNLIQNWNAFGTNHEIFGHQVQVMNGNLKHDDEAQIETLVSGLGKSKEGHVCLYCGKCYSRKYGLKIHIRTHTGYKPLKCKFCMRPFGDPSNLNKHVRLHAEGETPYRCDLCGKILVRRRDLERHLKSRHMSEIHPGRNIAEESINHHTDDSDHDEEQEKTLIIDI